MLDCGGGLVRAAAEGDVVLFSEPKDKSPNLAGLSPPAAGTECAKVFVLGLRACPVPVPAPVVRGTTAPSPEVAGKALRSIEKCGVLVDCELVDAGVAPLCERL